MDDATKPTGNALRVRRCRAGRRANGLARIDATVPAGDRSLVLDLHARLRHDASAELRGVLRRILTDEGGVQSRADDGSRTGDLRPQAAQSRVPPGGNYRRTPAGAAVGSPPPPPHPPAHGAGTDGRHENSAEGNSRPAPFSRPPLSTAQPGLPPTDGQLDFARRIAGRRGISIPADLDRESMRQWISENR